MSDESFMLMAGSDPKTMLRYWAKGPKDIMLLHGMLAHSYWWHWVVREWELSERVFAPDFTGMGKSSWRKKYSLIDHVHEVARYITTPSWIVGHSYGGVVAYGVAVVYPEKVKGVVMVDSPLQAWNENYKSSQSLRFFRPREYEDLETMKQSFVLIPEQPFVSEEIKAQIFHRSYVQTPSGLYRWSFDPTLMRYLVEEKDSDLLYQASSIPMLYIQAENSPLSQRDDFHYLARWAKRLDHITIPGAYHAALLDQPIVLQSIITDWISSQH